MCYDINGNALKISPSSVQGYQHEIYYYSLDYKLLLGVFAFI